MVTLPKPSLILFLSCFFLCHILSAQKSLNTDSLVRIVRITKDNNTKARLLLRLAKEEEISNPEKSLQFSRQALQVAKTSGFDSAEVRALIQIGVNLSRMMKIREAIDIGEEVVQKATKNNMELEIADGRSIMAVSYAQVGDFDNSSRLYFENLKLYEKLKEKKLLGRTMGNIGADFLEQQSYVKALEYSNKALEIGLETKNLTLVTDQYNNLAAIYQVGFNDMEKAMLNYSRALTVAREIEDFQQQGGIMLNIGHIYMKLNEYDSAFQYFDQAFKLFQTLNSPGLMAEGHTAMGEYFFKKGDYQESRKFALTGLRLGEENGILRVISESTTLLYKISLSEKDTIAAYNYYLILTKTKDSLNVLQNQKEIFKLEFQYNQEKIAKEQKIKQQRSYFIFGFIILGLLSGLYITILLNSRQKIKIKNTILEKEKAESDLKFKSKELSINLMALLKKNELITEISQKLSELENAPSKSDLKESAIKLSNEIKQKSDDRLWQEFSMRFKEINAGFYDKLLNQYPDLTQSELKLCAYLRLNMSSKEISDLTGQRTETLEKARYRLRKKFELTNSEVNLVSFLSQI